MAKYFVLNEHTLGYVIEGALTGAFGILHASILRGSTFDRLDGWTITDIGDTLRPATLEDFTAYGVSPPNGELI